MGSQESAADVKMEILVLVRSLKSSILSSTSIQMGKTFWGVGSAAVEQSRGKANMETGNSALEADPRIPPPKKMGSQELNLDSLQQKPWQMPFLKVIIQSLKLHQQVTWGNVICPADPTCWLAAAALEAPPPAVVPLLREVEVGVVAEIHLCDWCAAAQPPVCWLVGGEQLEVPPPLETTAVPLVWKRAWRKRGNVIKSLPFKVGEGKKFSFCDMRYAELLMG